MPTYRVHFTLPPTAQTLCEFARQARAVGLMASGARRRHELAPTEVDVRGTAEEVQRFLIREWDDRLTQGELQGMKVPYNRSLFQERVSIVAEAGRLAKERDGQS